ncbi:preprotein translocase subunit secg [hydrocarbon metagenome]|uniref:Preprotein translocase subunit secg n=1 Tax=hydrocarbon metagenome TaxID=938273 RepID=A0A0W8E5B9_9ZZZZ
MLKTIALVIQVLLGLGLIATILLQSGKSAGLSGSIAGGSEALFGGKKKGLDELLAKITAWLVAAFMIITLVIAIL